MPSWTPDWRAMMAAAPEIQVPAGDGYVYLIADAHLGDPQGDTPRFLEALRTLVQPRLVVFLGDLFKVWLALPRYWDAQVREVLEGFARLRQQGAHIAFVVGNREYFLPRDPARASARGLPFDHIISEAATLTWNGRRYGLAHGDLVNRADRRYLLWRKFSRGRAFEAVFRTLPAPLASAIARYLEATMARSNLEYKVTYPLGELEAFAETVLEGLDGFFIGHFHRDELLRPVKQRGFLRIVPDWLSRKTLIRLAVDGTLTTLSMAPEAPPHRPASAGIPQAV